MQFVDQANPQELAAKSKLVLIETPSNPLLWVGNIADICNDAYSPGAYLVVHSCIKYLNGHFDVVGSAVITTAADVATNLS